MYINFQTRKAVVEKQSVAQRVNQSATLFSERKFVTFFTKAHYSTPS